VESGDGGYEPEGREFESLRAHHFFPCFVLNHLGDTLQAV